MKNLQLVIFDMDGLMFDTERRYGNDMETAAKRYGITVDMQVLWDSVGSTRFDFDRFLVSVPEGVDASAVFDTIVPDAVDDMCANGVPMKKGLRQLLDLLRRKGIRAVVATSTDISLSGRLLKAAGVWEQLDFVLTRRDVAHGKPAPDIFLAACERAGVPAENALVLEDSINGGLAAKAAGIPYIIVPDVCHPSEEVARYALAVVDSLEDVAAMLAASEL